MLYLFIECVIKLSIELLKIGVSLYVKVVNGNSSGGFL